MTNGNTFNLDRIRRIIDRLEPSQDGLGALGAPGILASHARTTDADVDRDPLGN